MIDGAIILVGKPTLPFLLLCTATGRKIRCLNVMRWLDAVMHFSMSQELCYQGSQGVGCRDLTAGFLLPRFRTGIDAVTDIRSFDCYR